MRLPIELKGAHGSGADFSECATRTSDDQNGRHSIDNHQSVITVRALLFACTSAPSGVVIAFSFWITGEMTAMMNRRNFLRSSALGLTALAATQTPGGLFANPYGKPVGLQLFTLRDELQKDMLGTLKQVAAIGIKEVEIYDLYGKTAAEFAKILKDDGLTAPSGHYMTKHLHGNWEKEIENAKTIGMKYMVNAILDPEERKTFDDWKRLAELFNKAGEQTQKAGIQYCYHNHNFEFQKYRRHHGV